MHPSVSDSSESLEQHSDTLWPFLTSSSSITNASSSMNAKEKHSEGTDYTLIHSEIYSECLQFTKNIFLWSLKTLAELPEPQDIHTFVLWEKSWDHTHSLCDLHQGEKAALLCLASHLHSVPIPRGLCINKDRFVSRTHSHYFSVIMRL